MLHILMPVKGWLVSLALTITALFAPIASLMVLVGVAIALDTIFGVWKAYKTNEQITSRKMSNLTIKLCLYQGAMLLFYLVDLYILQGSISILANHPLFASKVLAAWLVITEVKSVNENYAIVTGTDVIKNTASSIVKLREFYSKIIKK